MKIQNTFSHFLFGKVKKKYTFVEHSAVQKATGISLDRTPHVVRDYCSISETSRITKKTFNNAPNLPVVCSQCKKPQWSMNLAAHYRRCHDGINIGEQDKTIINEAEAHKDAAAKQLKSLNTLKQRKRRGAKSVKPPPKRAKVDIFKTIVVPPPLDLNLGVPATQTTNTQQQEITARTTGSQNTTRTQQQETVAATVVAGLRTHVFQVELGRNIAAIERATNKHVTLEKGTRISIFKAETLFDPFFVVVVHDIIYRPLQGTTSRR